MDNLDTKKKALQALEDKHGIVTEACNSIGLARSTFYKWMEDDLDFKKAVQEVGEVAIDYVEGRLFQKISGVTMKGKGASDDGDEPPTYEIPPSDTAIIFYLKTKAKHRGYIERSEISPVDPDGKKFEITLKI